MHLPVLLQESIEGLSLRPGDTVIDATLGGGGHSREILKRILPGGRLIAVDRDQEAIDRNYLKFEEFKDSIIFINENFREIKKIMLISGEKKVKGAIFDLGMSSFQVDDESRGFSFLKDGPLDMRFKRTEGISARDVINSFTKEELVDIIKEYGEERYAKHLVNVLYSERKKKRIETTKDLSDVAVKALGRKYSNQRLHPACRTFQALRIFVNDELGAEEEALNGIFDYLEPEGRVSVISFHSLEDRIAKRVFRDKAKKKEINIITKKPIIPSEKERKENPRARSAKLRIAEKIL
ncbi:MAG: 16S rRNA (cytosine(1402)-N(4))-methyltransferase RsmH [Candidatus Omnitrophota bacterium]